MRVLFSPVGGSDPINRMLDGPMLHCCRVYKPDVVYLYMSSKILEYENRDNRYTIAIAKLGEKLNHKFEVIKIERPELIDVQLFDNFYDDFEQIFSMLEEKYPNDELYVNVSSGTPAIKSTLVINSAMSDRKINVIQVSSGEKKPMHDRDRQETYDIEECWELDIDNEGDEFTDRTSLIESPRFLVKVKKDNIKKLISAYDYSAARALADDVREYLSSDAYSLICAADERLKLNYNGVVKELQGTDFDIVPEKNDEKRRVSEYLLWLGIVLKKKDYLSFIRGITPAAMAVMESAVKNKTEVGDIRNYCKKVKTKSGTIYKLTEQSLCVNEIGERIYNILIDRFGMNLKDNAYSTAHLEPILANFCDDESVKKNAAIIREAEQELRNQAAHSIVSVGNELFERKIHMTAEKLYDVIMSISVRIGLVKKSSLNSYEEMNELILKNV